MVGSMKEKWQKFKNYLKKDKRIFAKGICFEKLFAVFIIGSVIGSLYEEILNFLLVYSRTGQFVWEYRRGVIYGPFNIIYGIGAVIIVSLLADRKHKWYETILYGSLLGGGIEYLISFLQETFTRTTSWDYSNKFLDINGRTTLPFMLIWGIFSFLFRKMGKIRSAGKKNHGIGHSFLKKCEFSSCIFRTPKLYCYK